MASQPNSFYSVVAQQVGYIQQQLASIEDVIHQQVVYIRQQLASITEELQQFLTGFSG
jgi:hypothetical protein